MDDINILRYVICKLNLIKDAMNETDCYQEQYNAIQDAARHAWFKWEKYVRELSEEIQFLRNEKCFKIIDSLIEELNEEINDVKLEDIYNEETIERINDLRLKVDQGDDQAYEELMRLFWSPIKINPEVMEDNLYPDEFPKVICNE